MDFLGENVLLGLAVYGGVILAFFWIAMVVWAYQDMGARTGDRLAQWFVSGVVALFNVPGLLIYFMLRPRETLSDAYERSLEEEALLQEIEEKPKCPGCTQRVQVDWQACPECHTRLKKPCVRCNSLLELNWDLCPYCATDQSEPQVREDHMRRPTFDPGGYDPYADYAEPPVDIPDKWLSPRRDDPGDYPQYVDGEY